MSMMRYVTFDHMILKLFSAYEERGALKPKSLLWEINNCKLIFFWYILNSFPTYCPMIGNEPPHIKSDRWKHDHERLKDYWNMGSYHPFTKVLKAEETLVIDLLQILQFDDTIEEDNDDNLLPDEDVWLHVKNKYKNLEWPPYTTPINKKEWILFIQCLIEEIMTN